MSDPRTERLPASDEVNRDALYQQLVMLSATARACERWAHVRVTHTLDVLLWLRQRNDYPKRAPYRVDQRTIERGIEWVTGSSGQPLPAGVSQAARDAVLCALIASSARGITSGAVDQVVQCGLFGLVLYP